MRKWNGCFTNTRNIHGNPRLSTQDPRSELVLDARLD